MINYYERMTITNNNSIRETILTAIALIPVVPCGTLLAIRYMKRIKVAYNKYYNLAKHKARIKAMYGLEMI